MSARPCRPTANTARADFFSGSIDLSTPVDAKLLDYWSAAVCPLDTEVAQLAPLSTHPSALTRQHSPLACLQG